MSLSTPVIFLIFNRADLTEKVFNRIAIARPKKLLVVADGPRFPEEKEKCEQARSIVKKINWDCEVLRNFSENNLGCKDRVSSGLNWAFNLVDEAIILEDDCIPNTTFYRFCEELLERYRDDQRIMMISGNNYLVNSHEQRYSYYFSRYTHIWGWATWRRAWRLFDSKMALWPEIRDCGWLEEIFENRKTGLVFKVGNTIDLADKVLFLLRNNTCLKEMINEPYEYIRKNRDWKFLANKYKSIYEEILTDRWPRNNSSQTS